MMYDLITVYCNYSVIWYFYELFFFKYNVFMFFGVSYPDMIIIHSESFSYQIILIIDYSDTIS